MGEVALKIVIGNREYPMRVPEENVAIIEEISKNLNESIEAHKRSLGLSDIQDAMAMTAFDCMVKLYSNQASPKLDTGIQQCIEDLNQKIEKALM